MEKEHRMADSQEIFISQYMTAYKRGMTVYQFAKFLNINSESVKRRRRLIRQKLGVKLPHLPHDNGGEHIEMSDEWKEVVKEQYELVYRDPKAPRRIVVTSAQNATPVFKPFLKCLEKFCEENKAELMVIPYRYKNPTSVFTDLDKSGEWWDRGLDDYIVDQYLQVCNGLRIMGHVKIQPTAVDPISGFDSYTGLDSAIFGHPKIRLKTVPTPSQHLPKILATTGTITKQNYTDSKAGQKGYFHHSYGAVIIEIDDKNEIYHVRHVHGDSKNGSFYDLDKRYTTQGVRKNIRVSGLVTGDSHASHVDEFVVNATYKDKDSMVNVLRPKALVYHDVEDFYPRNHHHRGNPILAYSKHHLGRNNVEEGLQITADFIDSNTIKGCTNILVKSNHDEALDRWLKEADPKGDPENAKFYHYMMYNILNTVKTTDTGFSHDDPFEFWCKNPCEYQGLQNKDETVFLKRDESFLIEGIEVGFHGDKGANGARGSVNNFAKIGAKTIIGHSHSPAIYEGCYQVGVSAKLNLEYVSGASSWLHTHCIIYPDGKRTLINVINGKWKL